MDIEYWASIAEIAGGTATLITLMYLAVQIRQNISLSKRSALEGFIDRLGGWWASMRSDPELLSILLKGDSGFRTLTELEKRRYHYSRLEMFAYFEAALEHGKSRGMKQETLDAVIHAIQYELREDGARDWWHEMGRQIFAKDFSGKVDSLIQQPYEAE